MLRVLICLFLTAWVIPAAAQEAAPENGLGPYRFGMSIAEAQATAPNASWHIEDTPSGDQTLLGGPRLVLGGSRFNAVYVFDERALSHIVLFGTAPTDCAQVIPAFIREMEATYGVFRSMPLSRELGLVIATETTPRGSEIRSRQVEGQAVSLHSSRRGAMFVDVAGEVAENAGCRVSVTFYPQPTYSGEVADVTIEEIDRAETLVNPDWIDRPTARSFELHYPRRALIAGISGRADLDCLVRANGRLRCLVAYEEPAGSEFGLAAVRIAEDFRLRSIQNGIPTEGKRLRVPIRFNLVVGPPPRS